MEVLIHLKKVYPGGIAERRDGESDDSCQVSVRPNISYLQLSKLYIINDLLLMDLTLIKPNESEELFLEKLILQLL